MLRQEILNNDTKTSKDDINTSETKEEENNGSIGKQITH